MNTRKKIYNYIKNEIQLLYSLQCFNNSNNNN